MIAEQKRLQLAREGREEWKKWGPYLSERAWGSVREDYSPGGIAWDYFPHDWARSKAYRWNEDGIAGISDDNQYLCFALALWNGQDAILKERLFGLTGQEGNHGEDIKEYYYYLDNTPSHTYMKCLYKYSQRAFPYDELVEENRRRGRSEPEYELLDTGVFEEDRYFDIVVEYAKADVEDIIISISATNRGPDPAELHLLPTLWFRNTWSWGYKREKPQLSRQLVPGRETAETRGEHIIRASHPGLGDYWLIAPKEYNATLLFTENETNSARLYPGLSNRTPYVKDSINDYVVHGKADAVNPAEIGTKAAVQFRSVVEPADTWQIRLRLLRELPSSEALDAPFENVLDIRRQEADEFYSTVAPRGLSEQARLVQRQALAGLLWSKQFYNYNVLDWLKGDPADPAPPANRWQGRNHDWTHLNAHDIISMPDKWEYPWFAAWDLAFHCLALAIADPDFAKDQLVLLLREWYMHPNGQLPAYEWAFCDVNPPVHAWASLRVFRIERRMRGVGDYKFLERVFHKLLLNFTWWVNRKDPHGRNVFQGGFLGLDNIGVFDRSAALPFDGYLDQSDGTSWMAMYCLNMLAIALELAREDDTYEDVATKFLEHFFYIAHAMNDRPSMMGDDGVDLWDEQDNFYYDVMHFADGSHQFLRVRSMVGIVPLFAVETMDEALLEKLPGFHTRLEWFLAHRPDLTSTVASITRCGQSNRRLFSVVNAERLQKILRRVLDEREFLSPYGIRSVSRCHKDDPYRPTINGQTYTVDYEPAESTSGLFGGNSNWRGPIWFPPNYLLIEALQKFNHYYGSDFMVECPVGSGKSMDLWGVATDLSQRLIALFLPAADGRRPVFGGTEKFQSDPHWRDLIPFHEYFHGDNGAGLGAAHQTGWTGLVAKLIQQSGK